MNRREQPLEGVGDGMVVFEPKDDREREPDPLAVGEDAEGEEEEGTLAQEGEDDTPLGRLVHWLRPSASCAPISVAVVREPVFASDTYQLESLLRKTLSHRACPLKLQLHGPVVDLSLFTAMHHSKFRKRTGNAKGGVLVEATIEALVDLVLVPGSGELTRVVAVPDISAEGDGRVESATGSRSTRRDQEEVRVFHIVVRSHEELEALVLPDLLQSRVEAAIAIRQARPAPPPPIALARMVVQPTPACLKDLTPATLSAVETWVEKVSPVEEESIQVLFSQAIEALLADDKVHVRVGRDRSPFSSQSPSESEEEGLRLRSAQKRLHALLVELATSVLAPLHSMLFPDPTLACQYRHLPRTTITMVSSVAASLDLSSLSLEPNLQHDAHKAVFDVSVEQLDAEIGRIREEREDDWRRVFIFCLLWSYGGASGERRESMDKALKELWFDALFGDEEEDRGDGKSTSSTYECTQRRATATTDQKSWDTSSLSVGYPSSLLRRILPPLRLLGEDECTFQDFVLVPHGGPTGGARIGKSRATSLCWRLWPGHPLYTAPTSALPAHCKPEELLAMSVAYSTPDVSPDSLYKSQAALANCYHYSSLCLPNVAYNNYYRHSLLLPSKVSVVASFLQAASMRAGARYAAGLQNKCHVEAEALLSAQDSQGSSVHSHFSHGDIVEGNGRGSNAPGERIEQELDQGIWRRRLPFHVCVAGEAYTGKHSLFMQLCLEQERKNLANTFEPSFSAPSAGFEGPGVMSSTMLTQREQSGTADYCLDSRWVVRLPCSEGSHWIREQDEDALSSKAASCDACLKAREQYAPKAIETGVDPSLGAVIVEDLHLGSSPPSGSDGNQGELSSFLEHCLSGGGLCDSESLLNDTVSACLRRAVGPAMYALMLSRDCSDGSVLAGWESSVYSLHTDNRLGALKGVLVAKTLCVCPQWKPESLHDVVNSTIMTLQRLFANIDTSSTARSVLDVVGHSSATSESYGQALVLRHLNRLLALMTRNLRSLSVFTSNDVLRVLDRGLMDGLAHYFSPVAPPSGADAPVSTYSVLDPAIEATLIDPDLIESLQTPGFVKLFTKERNARQIDDYRQGISTAITPPLAASEDLDEGAVEKGRNKDKNNAMTTSLIVRDGVSSFSKDESRIFVALKAPSAVASLVLQDKPSTFTTIASVDHNGTSGLSSSSSDDDDSVGDKEACSPPACPASHVLWADIARMASRLTINPLSTFVEKERDIRVLNGASGSDINGRAFPIETRDSKSNLSRRPSLARHGSSSGNIGRRSSRVHAGNGSGNIAGRADSTASLVVDQFDVAGYLDESGPLLIAVR